MAEAVRAVETSGHRRSPLQAVGGALWRVVVCMLIYLVGTMVGGLITTALGVPLPKLPEGVEGEPFGGGMLLGSAMLAIVLALVSARLRGSYLARFLAVAVFGYVAHAVNTAIEASLFTRIGGMFGMTVVQLPAIGLCAAAAAALFRPEAEARTFGEMALRFFAARTGGRWVCRLLLAVLAFPVVYGFFGMILALAAPQIIAHYQQEGGMFRIPAPGLMWGIATLRGVLFLVTALPVLIAWRGSRRGLVWVLGVAYWVLVGLAGLVQEGIMPADMRLAHSIEIGFDSFVYAAALVWLLVPKGE